MKRVGILLALFPVSGLSFSCSGDEQITAANEEEAVSDDAPNGADDDTNAGEGDDDAPGPMGSGAEAFELLAEGDADRVSIEELFQAPTDLFCPGTGGVCPGVGVDLEFNPTRPGELWAVLRQPYAGEPCDTPEQGMPPGPGQAGCGLMDSMVAIFRDATGEAPEPELQIDGNAWHFMRLATSIAFADDDTFATVGEARTGNYFDIPIDFMGPTWWSSSPEIFAQEFQANGSHLDMLHGTPFGMGIAHQRDHVFWAFNGQVGSVDRYDFHAPHEPGGEDHSDGEYARYATGQLKRLEGVPSHMDFHSDGTTLFIADSGNQRIVSLDTTAGGERVPVQVDDNQIANPVEVMGTEVSVVVPPGVMALPSGLTVYDDHLIVTDAQTSRIHVFDEDGAELGSLDTGLDSGSLAGVTVGPDDKVYFVDWPNARVLRISVD